MTRSTTLAHLVEGFLRPLSSLQQLDSDGSRPPGPRSVQLGLHTFGRSTWTAIAAL